MIKSSILLFSKGIARQLIMSIMMLANILVISRILGPEANGIFTFLFTTPVILIAFLGLGFAFSNVYYISKGQLTKKTATSRFIRFFLPLATFLCLLVAVASITFSEAFPTEYDLPLYCISIFISFISLLIYNHTLSVFQGTQNFSEFNALGIAQPACFFIVILLFCVTGYLSTKNIPHICYISYGLSAVISALTLKKHISQNSSDEQSPTAPSISTQLKFGIKGYIGGITGILNQKIDFYIVLSFLGAHTAGIYSLASQISERVHIISQAVSQIIFPKLSKNNDDRFLFITCRCSTLLTTLASITIYILCKLLISPVFGEQFEEANSIIASLLIGCIFASYSKVLANGIAAKGRPELNFYTGSVSILASIACSLILIPQIGIIGAAYSAAFSMFINLILKLMIYNKFWGHKYADMLSPADEIEFIRSHLSPSK